MNQKQLFFATYNFILPLRILLSYYFYLVYRFIPFLDVLSMVIVAVAVHYLLTGTSLSRKELYKKIDGTTPQLRHPPDNLLDI